MAAKAPFKRLVVLSDGTWQNENSPCPTNILKITKSLKSDGDDGIQTCLYYDAGVGTGGRLDSIMGGAMGAGIDANLKQLYIWLACNYDDGDEIYMFGFSRGSYTVRSLSGFIFNCGLVRQEEISEVTGAYEIYRSRSCKPGDDPVKAFRMRYSYRPITGERVPVKLLACFDTVGALGLPDSSYGGKVDDARYSFHDTKLSPNIENAIHMLSTDEERGGFKPTKMTENKANPGQLTQLFFPGRHSGVGGGEPTEVGLSNYTLNWLIGEMKRRGIKLAFHMERIEPGNLDIPPAVVPRMDWWTSKMMNLVAGRHVRPITSVDECHVSVGERYVLQPTWRPASLKNTGHDLAQLAKNLMERVKGDDADDADGSSGSD